MEEEEGGVVPSAVMVMPLTLFFWKTAKNRPTSKWRLSPHVECDSTWRDDCQIERSQRKLSALHLEI